MTSPGEVSPIVRDEDKLGRDVKSERSRRRIQNKKLAPEVFLDNASPSALSVSRLAPGPEWRGDALRPDLAPDGVIAKLATERAKALGRPFLGWAELSVLDASKENRRVLASPLEGNFWHADIVLPPEAETDAEARKKHASFLAARAAWRSCPEE